MSYSRWGGSRWYTYWEASTSELSRDEQVLSVNGSEDYRFTFRELSEDMDECLNRVTEGSFKELLELKGYMEEFLKDVTITHLKK